MSVLGRGMALPLQKLLRSPEETCVAELTASILCYEYYKDVCPAVNKFHIDRSC